MPERPSIADILDEQSLLDILVDQGSPTDALSGELGVFLSPRGGVSSEVSATVTHPSLNGGRPTNIPLLVRGQSSESIDRILNFRPTREDEAVAIKRAVERQNDGFELPSFLGIPQAEKAADARSKGKRKK